jgi:hypothetical protein
MTTAFRKRLEGDESADSLPDVNLSSVSIFRLQSAIEANLRRLQRLVPVADAEAAEPLSSASAEIADVFGRSSQCSSVDVRNDLDLIDWTLAGSADKHFRKAPEGESPEDIRS